MREAPRLSLTMVALLAVVCWPSLAQPLLSNATHDSDDPKVLFARAKPGTPPTRLEVVLVHFASSNASVAYSKALSRALKSVPAQTVRGVAWRVRNFVLTNHSAEERRRQVADDFEESDDDEARGVSEDGVRVVEEDESADLQPQRNALFAPNLIPQLCNFLERTKAVAMVNLIEDAGSERLLSLIANSAAVPLVPAFHSNKHFHHRRKDEGDLLVNLAPSARTYATALGKLLVFCHWHTFAVLFDETSSSPADWKTQLSNAKIPLQAPASATTQSRPTAPPPPSENEDYDSGEEYYYDTHTHQPFVAEESPESAPSLQPTFHSINSRQPGQSAFRALNEIAQSTRGIVVLLCSESALAQVFLIAKELRMLNGEYVFILTDQLAKSPVIPDWVPSGLLALRSTLRAQVGKESLKRVGHLIALALSPPDHRNSTSATSHYKHELSSAYTPSVQGRQSSRLAPSWSGDHLLQATHDLPNASCWKSSYTRKMFAEALAREIRSQLDGPPLRDSVKGGQGAETFEVLNLVEAGGTRRWKPVGSVSVDSSEVRLDTIQFPGGRIFVEGSRQLKSYRIATVVSPPFVMLTESLDNKTCENGCPCLKVSTNNPEELALIFADFEGDVRLRWDYEVFCCDGFMVDMLHSVSQELNFRVSLYLVPDAFFGSLSNSGEWNGLMRAILSGSAHMCFAPFSVTSIRSTGIDFSTPFFFSGVGFLGLAKTQDVPLLAFLAPFSFELWAAIFTVLNITAIAVALFEWLSPFGLNPWGRQRTKNFTMASALWVVWGRLFSHLVAFKAPKSWPNKFLINVWGGFSVIFVASYTANIAALFAGMYFGRNFDVHDRSLLSQRVAAVKHTATHFYIKKESQLLWEHIQKFPVTSFQQGVDMLKNGSLDLLTGDGPLLDYYRGSDPSCTLVDVSNHDKIGDDTYAIGMGKGFPLKDSISGLIAKYLANGYMDHLQGKWYDQLGCFRRRRSEIYGARALGVDAVAGMIVMLALGMAIGMLIVSLEHFVYKYFLPCLRKQPKGTLWRSTNIMFFSQKLYRFINCVELVSPHHAAKELVNTLRHGQITSLFQKSVKRKEHEQRRRRKSKAQFFEMIQEVRRVQKQEKQQKTSERESEAAFQARLQSNKNMPKLIRVLGVEADVSNRIFETSTASREPFQGPVLVLGEEATSEASSNNGMMETEFTGEGDDETLRIAPSTSVVTSSRSRKSVGFDVEDTNDSWTSEFGSDDASRSAFQLSPSLNETNLRYLSKNEIITLWRNAELDLRGRLSGARKENEALLAEVQRLQRRRPP